MIRTMPLAELLATKSAVDAALIALASGAAAPAAFKGKVKKVKEESKGPKVKRVTQGSAWADFTKMVCSERAEAYAAFKEASEIKQGVAPRFVASYRSEHEAEWEEFQADWNAKHPKLSKEEKASAAASEEEEAEEVASVASAPSAEVKKRKGPKKLSEMTAEELAAHKAKVAAKQAAKAAPTVEEAEAKAAAPFVIAAPAPVAAPVPAPAPAPEPVAAPEPEEEEAALEPRTFTTGGQKYIRFWNTDAESWASGHLWMPKKKGTTERGSYVGELMADGSIGTDGDEPEVE